MHPKGDYVPEYPWADTWSSWCTPTCVEFILKACELLPNRRPTPLTPNHTPLKHHSHTLHPPTVTKNGKRGPPVVSLGLQLSIYQYMDFSAGRFFLLGGVATSLPPIFPKRHMHTHIFTYIPTQLHIDLLARRIVFCWAARRLASPDPPKKKHTNAYILTHMPT